jgi:SAM-dependent methyltransferase
MNPRSLAKRALLDAVAFVTQRHPVLLPRAAADEAAMLSVAGPYRVAGTELSVDIQDRACGTLTAAVRLPAPHNSSRPHWSSGPLPYSGPASLHLDVRSGEVRLGDRAAGTMPVPLPTRRFCWSLDLDPRDGTSRRSRVTGHYLQGSGAVDDAYYSGDNYVDYEAESLTTREAIVDLARRFPFSGTALEIGCATGALLEDLQRAGFDAVGVDYSAWAVERARARVGVDRVWQIDIERDLHHEAIAARAPFGALVMLSVLEHFADPFGVLARLSAHVAPGGRLFLTTTNAGGLGRSLFGGDWEGYFDWTHLGVDQVSARSLREGLARIGWRVDQLETTVVWDGNADPTHATLREWFASDARFRRLLIERDLGDLISCVATKA